MPIRPENRDTAMRIIVASCAVFAILLIISLVIGLVSLARASSRRDRLAAQLKEINAQIEMQESNLEYYNSNEYIEMVAREYLDMQGNDEITFVGK